MEIVYTAIEIWKCKGIVTWRISKKNLIVLLKLTVPNLQLKLGFFIPKTW